MLFSSDSFAYIVSPLSLPPLNSGPFVLEVIKPGYVSHLRFCKHPEKISQESV